MLYNEQWDYRNVCQNTALLIEMRGWCQGQWESSDGRVCLETAIAETAGSYEAMVEMRKIIALALQIPYGTHIAWNDTAGRTQAEVVGLLRQLAFL